MTQVNPGVRSPGAGSMGAAWLIRCGSIVLTGRSVKSIHRPGSAANPMEAGLELSRRGKEKKNAQCPSPNDQRMPNDQARMTVPPLPHLLGIGALAFFWSL